MTQEETDEDRAFRIARGSDIPIPQAPMTRWRDISSAPKQPRGGRPIQVLAFAADPAGGDYHYYGVAQWTYGDPDFRSIDGWFWPFAIRPTHWQPLDPPPTDKG